MPEGRDAGEIGQPVPTLFLQRQPYRRRRLIDAVRVLPVFGMFLLLVPAVLVPTGVMGTTSAMFLFLFGCWTVMIGAGATISHYLNRTNSVGEPPKDEI